MVELTKSQQDAVEITDKPLVVVAGPGSGKTRVLTNKAIYLIEEKGYSPENILMTTFTVKASEEMRERIVENTSKNIGNMVVGTVHSLCENIIKEYGHEEIYTEYMVLEDFKRYLFIKKNLKNLNIDLEELKKLKRVRQERELIGIITNFYDTITENFIHPKKLKEKILRDNLIINKIIQYNTIKEIDVNENEIKQLIETLIDSYYCYLNLLNKNKFLDFPHLESMTYKIINKNDDVLEDLQSKYQYVLIDEFQDINPLQWKILSKIAGNRNNITCVGDKNQSIYGFRGANPNIFNKFHEEYSNSKEVHVNVNYRSRKNIVQVSNNFLYKRNKDSIDLVPDRDESCNIYYINDEYETTTARKILDLVGQLKEEDKISSFGDVAILFRSLKYHGQVFLELLNKEYQYIPYTVYGSTSFLQNEEIRSLIYLLAYVFSIEDKKEIIKLTSMTSLKEAICGRLLEHNENPDNLSDLNYPYFFKSDDLIKYGFDKDIANKIVNINDLRNKINEKSDYSIQDAFYELLGHIKIFDQEVESNKKKVINNIATFSEIIQVFSDIYSQNNLLIFFRLLQGLPENINIKENSTLEMIANESLLLMNIHQAKGLEFPVIIIPSLINRRFPGIKRSNEILELPNDFYLYEPYSEIQEEENLFYVAMSRAQDALIFSYFDKYDNSRQKPKISPFLNDIFSDLIEYTDDRIGEFEVNSSVDEDKSFKVLDYSAISTFIDCPERFKINYLYGFKAEDIFVQKVGTIYHNALAKVNHHLSNNDTLLESKIDKIIDESWIDLGSKNDLFKNKIMKGIKRYLRFMDNEMKHVLAIEKPVGLIKGNIQLRGRIDLFYENKSGEYVLMDFKARSAKSIEDTHVDDQLKLYSDALKNQNAKLDKAIAYPIEEKNLKIENVEIDIENSDKVYGYVDELLYCVNHNVYKGSRKGNLFCKDCPYRFICRYYKVK